MRITMLNDKAIKRKWRVILNLSFFVVLLNHNSFNWLTNHNKEASLIIWFIVVTSTTGMFFRIKWLYDNKREKLM
jgi:serine acetyltransferase